MIQNYNFIKYIFYKMWFYDRQKQTQLFAVYQ